ncbi:hypothetical protein D3C86_1256750 [compost metagenome]
MAGIPGFGSFSPANFVTRLWVVTPRPSTLKVGSTSETRLPTCTVSAPLRAVAGTVTVSWVAVALTMAGAWTPLKRTMLTAGSKPLPYSTTVSPR